MQHSSGTKRKSEVQEEETSFTREQLRSRLFSSIQRGRRYRIRPQPPPFVYRSTERLKRDRDVDLVSKPSEQHRSEEGYLFDDLTSNGPAYRRIGTVRRIHIEQSPTIVVNTPSFPGEHLSAFVLVRHRHNHVIVKR